MSECFPKPKFLGANEKVRLDLSNYTTKADATKMQQDDTSKFAERVDLASLKSEVDRLDIDKLGQIRY